MLRFSDDHLIFTYSEKHFKQNLRHQVVEAIHTLALPHLWFGSFTSWRLTLFGERRINTQYKHNFVKLFISKKSVDILGPSDKISSS